MYLTEQKANLTYYDFADNDRAWLEIAFERGDIANCIAFTTQNCCGKYFKFIAESYLDAKTEEDEYNKKRTLTIHSLHKLMRELHSSLGIEIPRDVYRDLVVIDGYYWSTQYPSDASFFVDEESIEECKVALRTCVLFINKIIIELYLRSTQYVVAGMKCIDYKINESALEVIAGVSGGTVRVCGKDLPDLQNVPRSLLDTVTFYCTRDV